MRGSINLKTVALNLVLMFGISYTFVSFSPAAS